MESLAIVILISLVCTKITDLIKIQWKNIPKWVPIIISMGIGIFMCLMIPLNIFESLNITVRWIDVAYVFSGILIGGLGSGIYELLDFVGAKTTKTKTLNEIEKQNLSR